MKLQKTVLTLAAALNAVYGVTALLAPAVLASGIGLDPGPTTDLVVRVVGSFCAAFAILAWGAREAAPSALLSSVVLALLAGYVLATGVNVSVLLTREVEISLLGTAAVLVDLAVASGLTAVYLRSRKVPVGTGAM